MSSIWIRFFFSLLFYAVVCLMYCASAGRRVCSSGSVCLCLGLWAQLLQSQIFEGNLTRLTRICNHHFLESLPKIPSVVTAWIFIYCVLPKESRERSASSEGFKEQPLVLVWMRFCFMFVSLHPRGIGLTPLSSVFKFLFFFIFSSTYRKPLQGLVAHYKTTMVIFLHTEDYCSPYTLLQNLMLMKISLISLWGSH